MLPATQKYHDFVVCTDEDGTVITNISNTENRDITLSPIFNIKKFKITYNLDGGINHIDNPLTYEAGFGVSSFFAPSKEGYTFKGWLNNAGEIITSIDKTSAWDFELTASWEKIDDKDPVEPENPETKDPVETETPKTSVKD